MEKAVASRPAEDFVQPDTVVRLTIDPAMGLPAREECPQKLDEFFIVGTEPVEYCPNHGGEPFRKEPSPEVPAESEDLPAVSNIELR
jgi:membrane carboxypeptidase/penicillin-binding protein